MRWSRGGLVLAVVSVLGCEDGGSPASPSVIGFSLALSPSVDTIFVTDSIQPRDTVRLVARVRGPTGTEVTGMTIAWRSSAPSVASVDATGLVKAVGPGDAVITADMSGVRKSARIRVVLVTAGIGAFPLPAPRQADGIVALPAAGAG